MILDRLYTAFLLFIFCTETQGILRKSVAVNQIPLNLIKYDSTINKVILTQKGYIQFLKYYVEVEPLSEYTFCIWMNSNNLTHNHPLLSYSKHEEERLIRVWITPHGHNIIAEISKISLFSIPVDLKENHWYHICQSWSSYAAEWNVFLNGHILSKGITPELKDHTIKGGGDIVVGQEYTDFDKGLDDGIEGAIYGFNFVLSSTTHTTAWENENSELGSGTQFSYVRKKREQFINEVPPATRYGVPVGKIRKFPNFLPLNQNSLHHRRLRYGDKLMPVVPIIFDERVQRYPRNLTIIPREKSRRISFEEPEDFEVNLEKQHLSRVFYNQPQVNTRARFSNIFVPSGINQNSDTPMEKSLGLLLVELSYDCNFKKGAPLDGPKVLVNWAKTTVRVFGGAILKSIPPFCK